MKTLYTAQVHVTGGRDGRARSSDGRLDTPLALPGALGGNGSAPNPEQLFGAGFAACFTSSLRYVASRRKVDLSQLATTAEVDLTVSEAGHYGLVVRLEVSNPGVEPTVLEGLVAEAEQVCAYSNATRDRVDLRVRIR